MTIQLINYLSIVELLRQVSMFKEFEVEGSRRGFESEVNKGKLGLCVPDYIAVYTKDQL